MSGYFEWPLAAVELVEKLSGNEVARQILDGLEPFVTDAVEDADGNGYDRGYEYGREVGNSYGYDSGYYAGFEAGQDD